MMTPTENKTAEPVLPAASLGKRMMLGAGIALILISIFLYSSGEPNPGWSKIWMLKPLLIVPVAGAMGGAFSFYLDHMRFQSGWMKAFLFIASVMGYIITLWLGTVLGLDGTLWD